MPKKLYERSTSLFQINQLPKEIISAIKNHESQYQLRNIMAKPLMAIKTESRKAQQGFFSKMMGKENESTQIYSIITDRWLIIVVSADKAISVLLYENGNFDVTDFESNLVSDTGIQITGFRYGESGERGSYVIGLGAEQPALNFRQKMFELTKF
jgi:hypothetical protein